ncbi:MAG: hypothetical protein LBC23_02900, partial [Coriobacteriales bacterium]|nr:hypothetical protein [Coriobacteriales bacterium]
FAGWTPAIAPVVTQDATYTATWEELPAVPTPGYSVIFIPGDHGDFAPVTHTGVAKGDKTPAPPTPKAHVGWLFAGWSPALASTVTDDVIYTALWTADPAFAPAPPTGPSAPAPAPEEIIINNSAPPAQADRYVTVTGAAAPVASSSSEDTTASPAERETSDTAEAGNTELADEETPLGSGQGTEAQTQPLSIWLVLSLIFFALVVLIGILLLTRRSREEEDELR